MAEESRRDSVTTKRVYFYLVDVGTNAKGPTKFEADKACEEIAKLPDNSEERYIEFFGDGTYCWIVKAGKTAELKFAKCSARDFPQLKGRKSPTVRRIPARSDEELVKMAHAVFFPDGVVGLIRSQDGPTYGRIAHYLSNKVSSALGYEWTRLEPLMRPDVIRKLTEATGISMAELEMTEVVAKALDTAGNHLGKSFKQAYTTTGAGKVRLVLKAEPVKDERPQKGEAAKPKPVLKSMIHDAVISLAKKLQVTLPAAEGKSGEKAEKIDYREEVTVFNVKTVKDEGAEERIDVLDQFIYSAKAFVYVDAITRSIDDTDAFKEIRASYRENGAEIKNAVALLKHRASEDHKVKTKPDDDDRK